MASLPKPQLVYSGSNQFQPDGGFKPTPKPRPIHVLKRGDVRQPVELITLTLALQSLARDYRRFMNDDARTRGVKIADEDVKLYVTKVESGSILAELGRC